LRPAELKPAESGDSLEYSVSVATSMTCRLLRLRSVPKLASIAASAGRSRDAHLSPRSSRVFNVVRRKLPK
jgi:hypothetical protein